MPDSSPEAPEAPEAPFEPNDHCWRQRLLLIFAASPADPNAIEQRRALAAQRAALHERDLLVATLYDAGDGPTTLDTTSALRARYGLAPGTFAVLLLGKDGGEKLRADLPVAAAAITELIDTMPMRQAELRERR